MTRNIGRMLPNLVGRKGGILLIDLCLATVAQLILFAILLRFRNSTDIAELTSLSVILAAPALVMAQAHSQVWHRVSMPDLLALVKAAAFVALGAGAMAMTLSPYTSNSEVEVCRCWRPCTVLTSGTGSPRTAK